LIIVPRYPRDAGRVEQAVRSRGQVAVLKTAVDRGEQTAPGSSGVLIVDTVGELRALYAVADIAFVGGSLFYRGSNKGGHNLMEPAILGLPTLFGPYNFSFAETVHELLRADAGFEVRDGTELEAVLISLVGNRQRRREVGGRAREVVLRGQGATQRNYELLVPLLGSGGERLPALAFERTMPPAVSDTDST
jgi:3-deoxy-D-manno-octulosonic-acid transferase